MILSDYDINCRRKEFDDQHRGKTGPLTVNTVNMIGHTIVYFFKYPIEDGEYGLCGVTARILKIHELHGDNPDVFGIDIAVPSYLPGFYLEELGLQVTSVVMEETSGNKTSGVCRYEDVDTVESIMNKKFDRNTKRPKLQLIVNNQSEQDIPVQ